MTVVNINLKNVGSNTSPVDSVTFYSPVYRDGVTNNELVSTAEQHVPLVDGVATVDLIPGPVRVHFRVKGIADTVAKDGIVPDSGPVTLNAVIKDSLNYTPGIINSALAEVDAALASAISAVEQAVDDELGEAVQTAVDAAESADDKVDTYTARLAAVEALGGLSTESPVDGQTASLIEQPDTLTRKAIEAISKIRTASVKEFGAVGDGIADDTDAINLALSTGLPVELHDGETYLITSTINHVGDVVLFCQGNATISQSGQDFTGLHFQGEIVSSSYLSSGKEIGDRVWRVADTSGVETGMLMEVISEKSWYYDPRPESTDARKSELHRVVHVGAGVVHTELEANDGYPVSESVTVNFYQPATVFIENVTIDAKLVTDGSPVRRGVILETVSDSILSNVTVRNYGLAGVNARRAYSSKIIGGAMENVNGDGSSYSIQTWGCTLFDVVGTRFSGCYSGVDISGMQVISLLCSVSDTVVTGGGIDRNGEQFGWKEFSALGESQRGHGTHGPSDRCRFSGNRISGVHAAFALRGRNHIVMGNQIESRSANGMIRIYEGYNFTISDNVCDRSFFGGKDLASQTWSSPQDKLAQSFVLVYPTYVTDSNGPLVIRGNKVQVSQSVVRLHGETHLQYFVLSYEGNTAIFNPKDKNSGVFLVDCDSPQNISNLAHISVGDVRFAEYQTKFDIFPDSMSVRVGAKISDYSVSGASYLEVVGGVGQSGSSVSYSQINFNGGVATLAFRISGITVTSDPGSQFSIRIKPYLYGGSGGSSSLTAGSCGSLSASGLVEHYNDATAGGVVQIRMRSASSNDSVVTGVVIFPVGKV